METYAERVVPVLQDVSLLLREYSAKDTSAYACRRATDVRAFVSDASVHSFYARLSKLLYDYRRRMLDVESSVSSAIAREVLVLVILCIASAALVVALSVVASILIDRLLSAGTGGATNVPVFGGLAAVIVAMVTTMLVLGVRRFLRVRRELEQRPWMDAGVHDDAVKKMLGLLVIDDAKTLSASSNVVLAALLISEFEGDVVHPLLNASAGATLGGLLGAVPAERWATDVEALGVVPEILGDERKYDEAVRNLRIADLPRQRAALGNGLAYINGVLTLGGSASAFSGDIAHVVRDSLIRVFDARAIGVRGVRVVNDDGATAPTRTSLRSAIFSLPGPLLPPSESTDVVLRMTDRQEDVTCIASRPQLEATHVGVRAVISTTDFALIVDRLGLRIVRPEDSDKTVHGPLGAVVYGGTTYAPATVVDYRKLPLRPARQDDSVACTEIVVWTPLRRFFDAADVPAARALYVSETESLLAERVVDVWSTQTPGADPQAFVEACRVVLDAHAFSTSSQPASASCGAPNAATAPRPIDPSEMRAAIAGVLARAASQIQALSAQRQGALQKAAIVSKAAFVERVVALGETEVRVLRSRTRDILDGLICSQMYLASRSFSNELLDMLAFRGVPALPGTMWVLLACALFGAFVYVHFVRHKPDDGGQEPAKKSDVIGALDTASSAIALVLRMRLPIIVFCMLLVLLTVAGTSVRIWHLGRLKRYEAARDNGKTLVSVARTAADAADASDLGTLYDALVQIRGIMAGTACTPSAVLGAGAAPFPFLGAGVYGGIAAMCVAGIIYALVSFRVLDAVSKLRRARLLKEQVSQFVRVPATEIDWLVEDAKASDVGFRHAVTAMVLTAAVALSSAYAAAIIVESRSNSAVASCVS